MTDTIRLSDRLELRGCGRGHDLYADDEYLLCLGDAGPALVALANPPRYDLPPGVITGSDGKFYAPGDVVRTLPDEMWERHYNGKWINDGMNHAAPAAWFYEVHPTAANLLQPLPAHTFRLPDGELACYRRDAAKLREAGAVLRFPGVTLEANPTNDDRYPGNVLMVEFPAPPKTERVRWECALRDQLPLVHNTGPITSYVARPDARATNPVGIDLGPEDDGDNRCVCPDVHGCVEVLATDGAL